jgi:hypothetical protein
MASGLSHCRPPGQGEFDGALAEAVESEHVRRRAMREPRVGPGDGERGKGLAVPRPRKAGRGEDRFPDALVPADLDAPGELAVAQPRAAGVVEGEQAEPPGGPGGQASFWS